MGEYRKLFGFKARNDVDTFAIVFNFDIPVNAPVTRFFFCNLGSWSQSKTECFTHFLISGHFHSSDAKDVCMFHCKILSFHSFKFSFKLTVHFITAHHYVKLIFQTKFFPSSQKNFNVVCSSLSTPVLCWFT